MPEHTEHDGSAWSSRAKLAFAAFAIIAAYFLVAEHRAHVLPYLPLLLLAGCALMHVFMHGSHGSHGGGRGQDGRDPPDASSGEADTEPGGAPLRDAGPKRTGHQQHGGRS
jgi:hypothetical protein